MTEFDAQVKNILGSLAIPSTAEQMAAAINCLKDGTTTIDALKMAAIACELGLIDNELALRTRACGPVLDIDWKELQLPLWATQPQLVTSAVASTEGKQSVITRMVALTVEKRAGPLVNAWLARVIGVLTLMKGHDGAAHFGEGGVLRDALVNATDLKAFDADIRTALANLALTGRIMVTTFRTDLFPKAGKVDSLELLRGKERELLKAAQLPSAPNMAAALLHLKRWGGVGGLTLTRASAYAPTPGVKGFDEFTDKAVTSADCGQGSKCYIYLLYQALQDLAMVKAWITNGELKQHIFFKMTVPANIAAMVEPVLVALVEVIFLPGYITRCAEAHVDKIFPTRGRKRQLLLEAHKTYAASLFSLKGGEALLCDAGMRPDHIKSAIADMGAPLPGDAAASKSFTRDYPHLPAPQRCVVLTAAASRSSAGERRLVATWRPLVPPKLLALLANVDACSHFWYRDVPNSVRCQDPVVKMLVGKTSELRGSKRALTKMLACEAEREPTVAAQSAVTIPVVPRHDGFVADPTLLEAEARELQRSVFEKGFHPDQRAEGRTVAVYFESGWEIGRVPIGGYSAATRETKVVFNRGGEWVGFQSEYNIKLHDEIDNGRVCFMSRGRSLDPAEGVERVQRHSGVSMELEELAAGVPSVFELDEHHRHVGPISLHHSSLSMAIAAVRRHATALFELAPPTYGFPLRDAVDAVLASESWLRVLCHMYDLPANAPVLIAIMSEALPRVVPCRVTGRAGRAVGGQGGCTAYMVMGQKLMQKGAAVSSTACADQELVGIISARLAAVAARAGVYVFSRVAGQKEEAETCELTFKEMQTVLCRADTLLLDKATCRLLEPKNPVLHVIYSSCQLAGGLSRRRDQTTMREWPAGAMTRAAVEAEAKQLTIVQLQPSTAAAALKVFLRNGIAPHGDALDLRLAAEALKQKKLAEHFAPKRGETRRHIACTWSVSFALDGKPLNNIHGDHLLLFNQQLNAKTLRLLSNAPPSDAAGIKEWMEAHEVERKAEASSYVVNARARMDGEVAHGNAVAGDFHGIHKVVGCSAGAVSNDLKHLPSPVPANPAVALTEWGFRVLEVPADLGFTKEELLQTGVELPRLLPAATAGNKRTATATVIARNKGVAVALGASPSAKAWSFELSTGEPVTTAALARGDFAFHDPDGKVGPKINKKPSLWPRADSRKMGRALAAHGPARKFLNRGFATAEAMLRKAEPKTAEYMDRVVPKYYEFELLEPGGNELLADLREALEEDDHLEVKHKADGSRWPCLDLRPEDEDGAERLTLGSTFNVIENEIDGRHWMRLSWVVQDQHEATLAAVWQHLLPDRAVVGRMHQRHLYANGKLMIPDTYIATQLGVRTSTLSSGAEDESKSLLWANEPELLEKALEQSNNREKVLGYLRKLQEEGLLDQVARNRRPSFFAELGNEQGSSTKKRRKST